MNLQQNKNSYSSPGENKNDFQKNSNELYKQNNLLIT